MSHDERERPDLPDAYELEINDRIEALGARLPHQSVAERESGQVPRSAYTCAPLTRAELGAVARHDARLARLLPLVPAMVRRANTRALAEVAAGNPSPRALAVVRRIARDEERAGAQGQKGKDTVGAHHERLAELGQDMGALLQGDQRG